MQRRYYFFQDEIWEGGTRIPQFVHYPNGLGTSGRTWDGLVSTIDVGPTFLDFAGIDGTNPHVYPMDGKSWRSAIDNVGGAGDDWRANRCLFFESSEDRSVRCGCDKYMLLSASSPERAEAASSGWPGWDAGTAEALLDLCDSSGSYVTADPSAPSPEANNVIASNPQRASELASLMQCHLDKTNANVDPLYQECTGGGGAATSPPTLRGTTLQPTPAPTSQQTQPIEEDITPPVVHLSSPNPEAYVTTGTVALHVWASDSSGIRNVKFQLRDPQGNTGTFENGSLDAVEAPLEKWGSPGMALTSSGKWSWRARVTDDSPARNDLTTQWTDLYFLGGDSPARAAVDMIKVDIEELINQAQELRPKFLRLGFHDCVGGCDGCVNLDNGDNNGLDTPIGALEPIVAKYAHNEELTAAIGSPISRADICALATLTGTGMAAASSPGDVTWSMSHIGRVDCSDADPAGRGGFDHQLPSPDLNTHELLAFFSDNFNFTSDETTVIMGAHSIGAAHREHSGFDGAHGWVNNPNVLSNGYFDMIM